MRKLFIALGVMCIIASACTKGSSEYKPDNGNQNPVQPVNPTVCIDKSGKEYKTVVIGQKRWMAENYAYLPVVYPSADYTTTHARTYVYSYEGNNVSHAKDKYQYERYGVLYNHTAALELCPRGWHLPTDREWKDLEIEMGMTTEQADIDGINDGNGNYRGTSEILRKFVNKSYGGTNESGLDILFAGSTDHQGFALVMTMGNFWTATSASDDKAYMRGFALMPGIHRGAMKTNTGLSVRYVKD